MVERDAPRYVPHGWRPEVNPPGIPDWETTASAWLLDLVPEYRQAAVRRHPVILAFIARHVIGNAVEGARQGYRATRTELGDLVPPHAIDAALRAWPLKVSAWRPLRARSTWWSVPCGVRHSGPGSCAAASKYSSNFRRWWLYLRVCDLACDFIARWFASFATADQRLPERGGTDDTGSDVVDGGYGLVLVSVGRSSKIVKLSGPTVCDQDLRSLLQP